MAVDYLFYSGKSNVGFNMNINEDYIHLNEEDFGDSLFAIIADGSGSKGENFRPGNIAGQQVEKMLARIYKKNPDLLKNNMRLFMEEAFLTANDVLIGFKLGNEADRLNYASSLTCAMIQKNGRLSFAHAGNTRLYIIRDQRVLQLTKDHTEGQKLVDAGRISEEDYYTAIKRLILYNGIGVTPIPEVQTAEIQLKKNDVIIMTTDGIHYAYRKEAFFDILMQTQTMDEAAEQMIETALKLRVYPDNLSVNVIWYLWETAEKRG